MIRLTKILNELIQESNIIQIPQSELDKSDRVYKFINQNFDKLKLKTKNRTINNPLILPTLQNYFTVEDYKGDPIKTSIGFYQTDSDSALGRMDDAEGILLININKINDYNIGDFRELIEHELIHSIDPKIKKSKLFAREFEKKGAQPSGEGETYNRLLNKYLKSPWEFDAFTAPLVNRIKRNINKSDNPDEMRDLLNQFLYDLKTKESDELASEPKYKMIPWLFTNEEWDSENHQKVANDYDEETASIKTWATKPTLYTRFLKRLFRNI